MGEKLTIPYLQAAATTFKLRAPLHKCFHILEFYKPYVRLNAKITKKLSYWDKITTKIIKKLNYSDFTVEIQNETL